jgi:hypothetical protein
VVQAFLLFLILVRRHDDTRFAWTLTGLLIRLSQALGLHRDGSHFPNLTPFQVEMRRRLFWAVCVLDLRSAEDQGTDLTIIDRTFDTQIPLNINDADISPDSPRLPEPREGTTDMAFSLIRYEICALSRRMHAVPSGIAPSTYPDACKSLEEREALLTEVYNRVENRLLKGRDSSNPLYWVASNVTKIVVAKMTLIIYQPVLFPGPGNDVLSEDARARLLNAAVDIFEYSHLLNTDPRCKQWRWLFQTWSHWHALAYTLIEVSHHAWGPKAERAWAALNLTFQSPNPAELEKLASHHAVWMPLRKLYFKVKKHREAELARLQADPQAARELDLQEQACTPPRSFGAIPSSVKAAIALDRWRKLVNLPTPPQEPQPQQPQAQLRRPHLSPQRSQTLQPNTTMAPLQASSSTDFAKPGVMEFLDAAMSDSQPFIPTDDLGPLLYPASDDIRAAFFGGYPTGDLARADTSNAFGFDPSAPTPDLQQIGRTPTSISLPSTLPSHVSQQQSQQSQQQTPQSGGMGVQSGSMNEDNNLPTWLWPTMNRSPDFLRIPSTGGEEMGMDMDEGFDWQTWQESLGRYEVEANGGRAGSTWGPGL